MQAAIDIGTNSVLLLVGETEPSGSVRTLEDRAIVTRLGQGLGSTGSISEEAAERTLAALHGYMELCDRHKVEGIAAVGTEALRRASNAEDFLLMVRRALGLKVEVITPEREAWLTYAASARDFGDEIVVVDIGGGSTELVTRQAGELKRVSVPIGCVTMLEEFIEGDPPSPKELDALRGHARQALARAVDPKSFARPNDATAVATAGTATTLMSIKLGLEPYDPQAAHGGRLATGELRDIVDELRMRTVEERRGMKGLIPERADVILPGALILHEAMAHLGYASVTVSDRGVKWGLFYEKFC